MIISKIKIKTIVIFVKKRWDGLQWKKCQTGEKVSDFHLFSRTTLQKMLGNFAELHAQPTEFLGADDEVVVIGNYYGESKLFRFFKFHSVIYIINDKKMLQFKQFTDTEKIPEAIRI